MNKALQLQNLVQNDTNLDKNEFRGFKIETSLDKKLLFGALGTRVKENESRKNTLVTVSDFVRTVSTPPKTPEKTETGFPSFKAKESQIIHQNLSQIM